MRISHGKESSDFERAQEQDETSSAEAVPIMLLLALKLMAVSTFAIKGVGKGTRKPHSHHLEVGDGKPRALSQRLLRMLQEQLLCTVSGKLLSTRMEWDFICRNVFTAMQSPRFDASTPSTDVVMDILQFELARSIKAGNLDDLVENLREDLSLTPVASLCHDFRLLRLDHGAGDHIKGHLERFTLEHCPQFLVLSTVLRARERSAHILVDGRKQAISPNLFALLSVVRSHLLSKETWTYIWADTICSDDISLDKWEDQAVLVHDIYKSAEMVITWLNHEFDYAPLVNIAWLGSDTRDAKVLGTLQLPLHCRDNARLLSQRVETLGKRSVLWSMYLELHKDAFGSTHCRKPEFIYFTPASSVNSYTRSCCTKESCVALNE